MSINISFWEDPKFDNAYLKFQRETNLSINHNHIMKKDNMSHHAELLEKVKDYTDNHEKFVTNGNKAAGTRARKALSEIAKLTKTQRKAIQETKNSA
jgi:hypothetical protein